MKIVSIAPYMPHNGISHAGGDIYQRHVRLASSDHDLVVICPETADNTLALERDPDVPFRRILVRRPSGWLWTGRRSLLLARLAPFLVLLTYRRALRRDEAARAALQAAERIELQWFDSVVLVGGVRRLAPQASVVGVFHDVISQAQVRMLRSKRHPRKRRLLAVFQLLLTLPLERRAMRLLDVAAVFSDKDRALLVRRGGLARIVVLEPPLEDEDMPREPRRDPRGQDVLFVGAMWRIENEDAALWLIRDVWPRVVSVLPHARLTIAGAGPTETVLREVRGRDSIRVTGYVPSLAPYYREASVVAAPLLLGAGVKVKSVIAMMWGLPVVATSVAAEGIDGPDVFAAVADDAKEFATALIWVLTHTREADQVARRAHEWAHRIYSRRRYTSALAELYGSP